MNVRSLLILAGLCVLLSVVPAAAQEGLPDRAELEPGWNWLRPGGETTCSDGSPYQFVAREGSGDDLLLYFEGGGACWSALTCAVVQPFTPAIDSERLETAAEGIFDFDNPANPFASYDVVIMPYCTGDVFMGDTVRAYHAGERDVTIRHKGYANAAAALRWVYASFPEPASVFITGESAGALGASFHAPWIIRQYPQTRVAVLGDSAGGYSSPEINMATFFGSWGTLDVLPEWLPPYDTLEDPADLKFEDFYTVAAAGYPDVTFAQYNTLSDEAQAFFLSLNLGALPLEEALPLALDTIARAAPNFRSFLAEGTLHTILHRPEFYTAAEQGVMVRDWVAALAAGEPVENVTCEACAAP